METWKSFAFGCCLLVGGAGGAILMGSRQRAESQASIHDDGAKAFEAGVSIYGNPNALATDAYAEWQRGWVDAKLKKEQGRSSLTEGKAR